MVTNSWWHGCSNAVDGSGRLRGLALGVWVREIRVVTCNGDMSDRLAEQWRQTATPRARRPA